MRSGVEHTVLPANDTTPAFTRSSLGGATTVVWIYIVGLHFSVILVRNVLNLVKADEILLLDMLLCVCVCVCVCTS